MPTKDKSHLHILVIATLALQLHLLHILTFLNSDLGIGVFSLAHPQSIRFLCFFFCCAESILWFKLGKCATSSVKNYASTVWRCLWESQLFNQVFHINIRNGRNMYHEPFQGCSWSTPKPRDGRIHKEDDRIYGGFEYVERRPQHVPHNF